MYQPTFLFRSFREQEKVDIDFFLSPHKKSV